MNSFRKFLGRAGLIALAVVTSVALPACSDNKTPEELGVLNAPLSSGDTITRKEVQALSTPDKAHAAVTVKETTRYLHKRTFKADQLYTIQATGTADYVDRLKYWMYRGSDNQLYRFNEGSNASTRAERPTVHIGTLDATLGSGDRSSVAGVASGNVEGSTRTLVVTRLYTHVENYNDVTYNLTEKVNAEFVQLQNAHMAWISGALYRADSSGRVERLSQKPSVHVGVKSGNIASSDAFDSSSISAGPVSFSGQSRTLIVSHEFIHEENYQRLRYTIQQNESATLVPEQSAHMCFIGGNLYEVKLGSNNVVRLSSKPVTKIGERVIRLSAFDRQVSVIVTPFRLSSDSRSILVSVRRNFWHEESFQIKEYHIVSSEIAHYDSNYKLWTVLIDGRIYVVAFAGDVVNDPNVEVIHAPSDLPKPDVIVIDGKNGNPPVVVPGKRNDNPPPVVVPNKPRNDDPPVVVPSKRNDNPPPVVVPQKRNTPPVVAPTTPSSDDPPAVVPGKRKIPSVTDTDDAPPVVVPRR